jgi:hypothetical protein
MSYDNPPPPPPPQYGASVPGAPGGQPKTSGKAIASLVTGILALPGICCWPLGLVLGIVGIVLGVLSRKEIEGSQGQVKGAGLALAGLICGAVAIVIIVIVLILWAAGVVDTSYDFES